jgi:hypothetical protein
MTVSTNLVSHRAPASVWDKRGWRGVEVEERVAPALASSAGVLLLAYGLSRRSLRGLGSALFGTALVGCAAAGLRNPRHAKTRWKHLFHRNRLADRLTSELLDTFPASDPLSVTAAGPGRAALGTAI